MAPSNNHLPLCQPPTIYTLHTVYVDSAATIYSACNMVKLLFQSGVYSRAASDQSYVTVHTKTNDKSAKSIRDMGQTKQYASPMLKLRLVLHGI